MRCPGESASCIFNRLCVTSRVLPLLSVSIRVHMCLMQLGRVDREMMRVERNQTCHRARWDRKGITHRRRVENVEIFTMLDKPRRLDNGTLYQPACVHGENDEEDGKGKLVESRQPASILVKPR